jgi:type II secretory pathway pseudopilin PulG
VLAIAGLIFLMVFIALPALQRSQRDTQRKDDIARLNTALNNYSSNNRGTVPTDWGAFVTNYVTVNGKDEFTDPDGTDYTLTVTDVGQLAEKDVTHIVHVYSNATCGDTGGSGKPIVSAGARKIAFIYKLEGGGYVCQNN